MPGEGMPGEAPGEVASGAGCGGVPAGCTLIAGALAYDSNSLLVAISASVQGVTA